MESPEEAFSSKLLLGLRQDLKADLAEHQKKIESLLADNLRQLTQKVFAHENGTQDLPVAWGGAWEEAKLRESASAAAPAEVAPPLNAWPGPPQEEAVAEETETEVYEEDVVEDSLTARLPAMFQPAKGGRSSIVKLEKSKVAGIKEEYEKKRKAEERKQAINSAGDTDFIIRKVAFKIVSNKRFEFVCAFMIVLCAGVIGGEADWSMHNASAEQAPGYRALDISFNVVFTTELILRVLKDASFYVHPNHETFYWNLMDIFLVASTYIEWILVGIFSSSGEGDTVDLSFLKVVRLLRLLRILRILRLVRFFSELRVMANGIVGSAKSLLWACVLLFVVMFMFGLIIMQFAATFLPYATKDESDHILKYFGSMPQTLHTMLSAVLGGMDWNDATEPLEPISPLMKWFFSAYVFFTVLCCLNIVTGIFVDNAKALKVADEDAMHQEAMKERLAWIGEVANLFSKISLENGNLSKELFEKHLESERVQVIFSHLGINTDTTNTEELWALFDADDSGSIDQEEFAVGIKQFHGAAKSMDLFKVRKECKTIQKQIKALAAAFEEQQAKTFVRSGTMMSLPS